MRTLSRTCTALSLSLLCNCAAPVGAPAFDQDGRDWTVGYRAGTSLGDGEPANDTLVPVSLFARRQLNDAWRVGVALDLREGDFEEPAKFLGLKQAQDRGPIDSTASHTQLDFWGERQIAVRGPNRFFWTIGIGFSSVDVDDVDGPLSGGGRFDVETDGGSETIPWIGLGWERRLGARWSFEATARYEHHVADWEVRDRVSGRKDSIDDYGTSVFLFGFGYRF